jgi:hypothetical protein
MMEGRRMVSQIPSRIKRKSTIISKKLMALGTWVRRRKNSTNAEVSLFHIVEKKKTLYRCVFAICQH